MKLTRDQVKHVAWLANLPLTEEEEKKSSQQLSEILDYIAKLDQVRIEDLPTFNVTGLSNVLASDEPQTPLTQEEALQNASQKENGMFVTKGVFDDSLG